MLQHFQQICAEYNLRTKNFTPYQHRFWINDVAFDYYHVSGKVNKVGTGIYSEVDIVEFIMTKIAE